jgi:O-antigen/teichoic acid export membrane protein
MSVRKAVLDTVAMSLVNVFRLLAQFIAVPILSRILSPSDYGLVAMAFPFVLFAMMIADAGIGVSLVRTPPGERHMWSTCFWLSIMLGTGLAAIMIAVAPLFAIMFDEPRLSPIVMALALVVFMQSLSSIPGASLQQELRFRLMAGTEVVAVVIGIAVAVLVATHGGGAWALVFQQLSFYGVRACLTLWFSSFRPQMIFELRSVTEHLLFGRDVLSVNIIGFFTRSIDNLVIGKVLSAAAVGVYSMAFQFARLPMMLVSGPLQYVFYSRLSMVKDDKHAIRRTFLVLTRILATMIFPTMGLVAAAYHPVFTLLLSSKWAASGKVFMLVAGATALQAVTSICGTIRMVLGRTDAQFRVAVEMGILWIFTLAASVWFGLEWVAVAYSVVFVLYSPRQLSLTLPLMDCSAVAYVRAVIGPVLVTLACIGVFLKVTTALQLGDWSQVALAALLMMVGIAASALGQWRPLLAEYKSGDQITSRLNSSSVI